MSGRKLDQGMLIKMVVEETRITAVHQVKLTEFVPKKDGQDEQTVLSPKMDVPEVVKGTIEGEWLIPNGGVLVASLGANTLDDGHGKAVVRERLMLVEAAPVPMRTTADVTWRARPRIYLHRPRPCDLNPHAGPARTGSGHAQPLAAAGPHCGWNSGSLPATSLKLEVPPTSIPGTLRTPAPRPRRPPSPSPIRTTWPFLR